MCGSNSQHNGGCLASTSLTTFLGSGLNSFKSKASQEVESSGEESSCLLHAGQQEPVAHNTFCRLINFRLCSPRNELHLMDWQLDFLLHVWQHPLPRVPWQCWQEEMLRKPFAGCRERRLESRAREQEMGVTGFQEMGKWGGMGWNDASCSGWGCDKLGLKVNNRINPFLLLNAFAEELGSTARPLSHCRQTLRLVEPSCHALDVQTTPPTSCASSMGQIPITLCSADLQNGPGCPGIRTAMGHAVPGAGVQWKSLSEDDGEERGAGEWCHSGG